MNRLTLPNLRGHARDERMMLAIKAEVVDPAAEVFAFDGKTMYGDKYIGKCDTIFVFASENEGGSGLVARGVVTSAKSIAKKRGIARQTPRLSITVRRVASARRNLGRRERKSFADWNDGRPETELNFKFYRQATNKIDDRKTGEFVFNDCSAESPMVAEVFATTAKDRTLGRNIDQPRAPSTRRPPSALSS